MIPVTNKQTIIICGLCVTIVAGSVVGIITLEKRRKEFAEQVAKMNETPWGTEYLASQFLAKRVDTYGSTSDDPVDPVISGEIKDQVDTVVPQSIDLLGSRFALTKDKVYAIYADLSIVRPGQYESVVLDYWPEDLYFLYNNFQALPNDVESMFGRGFCEEVLSLGLGRDLQLLVYTTTRVNSSFLKILLRFHEGRIPIEMTETPEDEIVIPYDPDSPSFAEADDEEFDEAAEDEAVIQEMLDAEEIEAAQPFFDNTAPIYIDPIGELSEMDIHEGWVECEWKYKLRTGLIYDENDEFITQEQILDWLGLELLTVICAPDVVSKFPERMIYVRNGKLKILYDIEIE